MTDFLKSPALDGSPGQAYASHKARANGIARFFAQAHPLETVNGKAGEDQTITLLAHLHAASVDPNVIVDGKVVRDYIPAALRRLNPGDGLVGTRHDYDMALKGLMTIAYRYPHLLGVGGVDFILNNLVPDNIRGGHPDEIEIVEVTFVNIDTPETENHLLMIESSRYLVNQLLHDRIPDPQFDNAANGLSRWILSYLQTIAKHDFLEFNARPYARLALHPLYNLHEFAREPEIRMAAQLLLDYTMMKFAVSSNRGRRVSPFRRLQHRINHQANWFNDLYNDLGDQVAGYFMAYTGFIDPEGSPGGFPPSLTYTALISASATYRPPPAAYILAMKRDNPPSLHRFYHGTRPRLRGSPDIAEGGLEIYYHSPSFLLSAGGSFLNSGYGHDEIDIGKEAWEQTSRAQATTLIPTQADTRFHDLIRFEPYPDPLVDPYADDPDDPDTLHARAVNIGVDRGLIAGANLRPAEKKTILEHATSTSPALTLHNGGLLMAWKGSGNDNLNVAKVESTTVLGFEGVEGIEGVVTLADATDASPALASHNGRLFLAWKGSGNDQLNLAYSDDGVTFIGKRILADSSEHSPALVSYGGRLYLAWTGLDEHLNVAKVVLFGNTEGGFGIEGLEAKIVLGDTSEASPALASHNGRLFLAWKGSGNDNLNLSYSDNGATFHGDMTFPDTSSHGPALTSHGGRLFLAWKGSGNENLNVAKVALLGNTGGGFGIEGLEDKVVLSETSEEPPALGSQNGMLFLAWKGEGEDHLNLRVSQDGTFQALGPWLFCNLGHLGFYVAAYRTPVARPEDLDPVPDNLALVYAMESGGMDFDRFRIATMGLNQGLPAAFEYGGHYQFNAPDGKRFAIWFVLTELKYTARVVNLNDQHAIGDLNTLPLVSGEYMVSPGGHEGLIEIRHPGCTDVPVVLDYRNAERPARDDNRSDCTEPWIDRARALFAIAKAFDEQGEFTDGRTALVDAVHLYDELLTLNPAQNRSPLAFAVIQALGRMGLDYSVSEADLRDWLANPLFTPYPAISQALLLLGRRLKAPVFLDVIVKNYEHTPGVASPQKVEDVKVDVLKAAILEGSNMRHGTNVHDFEQLLQP
ncbi:hypothetical protein [Deinococcus sonorensis]|uniref:Uncharacterized protein n=2 Tax=Deinococcus sonorensis TaxID=309891 RepID=A0AAU7UHN0_9DEIO